MKNDDVMFICPHCGASVKATAKACPSCGSDAKTGWSDGAEFADLELPDYDEILENESGKTKKQHPIFIVAAIVIVLAFVVTTIL